MRPIYLDHNATTPIDPAVFEAMLPFLRAEFGNPSSAHALGRRAREAVEGARSEVAALIGAEADEVVFTSGGTEASNIAIRGAANIARGRRKIVTSAIEHPATEACCALLEAEGVEVARIPPEKDGRVDPVRLARAVDGTTVLVTLIHAQNEIGTIQPVAEIATIARNVGARVHADAAQSLGKVPLNVQALGVDFLSIAGHKLYAPKGVGALYVRRDVKLPPLLVGAGQEGGRRSGTENVASIVALGAACRIAAEKVQKEHERQRKLAGELLAMLRRSVPGIVLVGETAERLSNTLNVIFPDVSGRQLLEQCSRVLASTGSACHADREDPSTILTALGIPAAAALGAVRLSLGRATTREEIEIAAADLAAAWRGLTTTVAASA
jgi:cysteine desulfurase